MRRDVCCAGVWIGIWLTLLVGRGWAQDGLKSRPEYAQFEQVRALARELRRTGRVSDIDWSDDGKTLHFTSNGKRRQVELSGSFPLSDEPEAKAQPKKPRPRSAATQDSPARAQQGTWITSPDGQWIARYRDDNVVLEPVPPPEAKPATSAGAQTASDTPSSPPPKLVHVTTSGTASFRYGTGCWVYGEELKQSSAMWWSPDSTKLAFYEVDERRLRDYYLTGDNTELYTTVTAVRYPKAGCPNPYVGLLVYDLSSGTTLRVDVGGVLDQYVFNVRFAPDGKELIFSRTNRWQNVLEVLAADVATGTSRVVVREQQETWQENRPTMQFLKDGKHFIWETERTGWKQYELWHLDGRLVKSLSTPGPYPVEHVVLVDEQAGWLYYSAYSAENPNNLQLHRVRLDGTEDRRLTPGPLHHERNSFSISPDHRWFVAGYESASQPPETGLFDMQGKQLAVLAKPDVENAKAAGLAFGELFSFQAADGQTDLFGILHKPAHFDPQRKYPLLISVYGGPNSRGISNRFEGADPYCEFGFVIAKIANRGTTGRGKAFESATYLKLGGPDIQDQADGVRYLCQRPYIDAQKVGIFGHSYGGYMTCLALLKYPELFRAGVAGAPVTDWKNYDTIYTERYMRTPQENPDGYRNGSCLAHAEQLQGRLLIMHGLIDDNVHPANTWQLVDLLQQKERRFDMLVYPRSKHGLGPGSDTVRWEYLCRHLLD